METIEIKLVTTPEVVDRLRTQMSLRGMLGNMFGLCDEVLDKLVAALDAKELEVRFIPKDQNNS